MKFTISISGQVPISEVAELYLEAEWFSDVDSAMRDLPHMIEHSFAVVSAADENGRIIGFARSFSDGVSDAYILDVVVRRSARKNGVATAMLHALTEYLSSIGIDWIVCIGVPGTENLYKRASGTPMSGSIPFRFSTKLQ